MGYNYSDEVRAKLKSWGLPEAPPGNIIHIRFNMSLQRYYVLVTNVWYWCDERAGQWIEAPMGPLCD